MLWQEVDSRHMHICGLLKRNTRDVTREDGIVIAD